MRQGTEIDTDMRPCHFLNSTCDMGINKRQRHATLPFLKIDRRQESMFCIHSVRCLSRNEMSNAPVFPVSREAEWKKRPGKWFW